MSISLLTERRHYALTAFCLLPSAVAPSRTVAFPHYVTTHGWDHTAASPGRTDYTCGFAAAHGGKALPFRARFLWIVLRLRLNTGGAAANS